MQRANAAAAAAAAAEQVQQQRQNQHRGCSSSSSSKRRHAVEGVPAEVQESSTASHTFRLEGNEFIISMSPSIFRFIKIAPAAFARLVDVASLNFIIGSLSTYAISLGLDETSAVRMAGRVTAAQQASNMVGTLFNGILCDFIGAHKVLLLTQAGNMVFFTITAFAREEWQLTACRIGAAWFSPEVAVSTVLMHAMEPQDTPTALSIGFLTGYMGLVCGNVLSVGLNSIGWQRLHLCTALLSLIGFIFTARSPATINASPREERVESKSASKHGIMKRANHLWEAREILVLIFRAAANDMMFNVCIFTFFQVSLFICEQSIEMVSTANLLVGVLNGFLCLYASRWIRCFKLGGSILVFSIIGCLAGALAALWKTNFLALVVLGPCIMMFCWVHIVIVIYAQASIVCRKYFPTTMSTVLAILKVASQTSGVFGPPLAMELMLKNPSLPWVMLSASFALVAVTPIFFCHNFFDTS